MLVHKHPARTALFPNTGVPQIQFRSLTVLRFFHQMHRNRCPRNHAPAGHLQIFPRGQFDLRGIIQKFLLHAVVVLLPAVIRKRRHIIKNQSVVLGVELRRSVRRSRAPSRAITVDQLAKVTVVRGFLLRPCSNESQQSAGDRQPYIQQPAPSLGISVDGSAHRCSHFVFPRYSGTRVCGWMSQRVLPTLLRFRPFCKCLYAPSWVQLFFAPLLLIGAGAVLLRPPTKGEAASQELSAESSAAPARGDRQWVRNASCTSSRTARTAALRFSPTARASRSAAPVTPASKRCSMNESNLFALASQQFGFGP